MRDILKKIKRVQPMIKVKKTELDNESRVLGELKTRKALAVESLRGFQRKYLDGVAEINKERQQGNIQFADALGASVEMVKERWHETLSEISEIESREKMQLDSVLKIRTELKKFEKMEEVQLERMRHHETNEEQKQSDEQSVQKWRPS